MPRINDVIDQLGQAQFFLSMLDLTKGYWQVPIKPSFQQMMVLLTKDTRDIATAYLDDLVIFSGIWEIHLQHLAIILQQLHKANLTVKPQNCQIGVSIWAT